MRKQSDLFPLMDVTFILYGSVHRNILGCHFHFLWKCSSQYSVNFQLPQGHFPYGPRAELVPCRVTNATLKYEFRLATKDVASILYGSVPHKVNFGHLATSAPLLTRLHTVICSLQLVPLSFCMEVSTVCRFHFLWKCSSQYGTGALLQHVKCFTFSCWLA